MSQPAAPQPEAPPDVPDLPSGRHSAAWRWPPLRRFIAVEARVGRRAARHPATLFAYEFVRFGVKQAWACLFGALLLALLIGTHLFYPRDAWLNRYDFLTLAAIAIQAAMLYWRLETVEEAKAIGAFHVVGTAMELFKTAVGSWIYPEAAVLRLGGVPLFTGFMYAAVGSYISRCWRLFDFRFDHHPPMWALAVLSIAIYVNFFTHHFVTDARPILYAATVALFWQATVHFKVWRVHRRMPLLLGLVLVALFIWLAENIGTFTAAWVYPSQKAGWHVVPLGKLGAWLLLMIISYTMVAAINGVVAARRPLRPARSVDGPAPADILR